MTTFVLYVMHKTRFRSSGNILYVYLFEGHRWYCAIVEIPDVDTWFCTFFCGCV